MINRQILPKVELLDTNELLADKKRLLIISEGFEERSIRFLSCCEHVYYDRALICKYSPRKDSKYDELIRLVAQKCDTANIQELTFNRYDPFTFEVQLQREFEETYLFDEIVVDISVMSKYMIMQILYSLSNYTGVLKIIYTEPLSYAPLEDEWQNDAQWATTIDAQRAATILPSFGVHDIVRTPLLTSIVMQKSPALLVAFLSFNEQLIRALLSEYNPMHLYLINGTPPHLQWREQATSANHRNIIEEYSKDNPLDEKGILRRKTSTLHYIETFDLLAKIYREHCVENRIVLAPTGSKMQVLGCALISSCAQYFILLPTP